jgi:hypothetical protein
LFAVGRSVDLEACNVCESALRPCHSGFAKIVNNATSAANVTTTAIRPISAIVDSAARGGSGTGSGHEARSAIVRRSSCTSNEGTVGAEVTRSCAAAGIRDCSRNCLGAYLLGSESLLSSLIGALIIASYALVSDQIYFFIYAD